MARKPDLRWQRLRPGEDPLVDQFLAEQADTIHERLDAANAWHEGSRRYRLDPPIPRGASELLYEIDSVSIQPDKPRRIWILAQKLLIVGGVVWAGFTYSEALLTTAKLLMDFFRP